MRIHPGKCKGPTRALAAKLCFVLRLMAEKEISTENYMVNPEIISTRDIHGFFPSFIIKRCGFNYILCCDHWPAIYTISLFWRYDSLEAGIPLDDAFEGLDI
jgi:hypothetical protein